MGKYVCTYCASIPRFDLGRKTERKGTTEARSRGFRPCRLRCFPTKVYDNLRKRCIATFKAIVSSFASDYLEIAATADDDRIRRFQRWRYSLPSTKGQSASMLSSMLAPKCNSLRSCPAQTPQGFVQPFPQYSSRSSLR